jgi:hypothetical protein
MMQTHLTFSTSHLRIGKKTLCGAASSPSKNLFPSIKTTTSKTESNDIRIEMAGQVAMSKPTSGVVTNEPS